MAALEKSILYSVIIIVHLNKADVKIYLNCWQHLLLGSRNYILNFYIVSSVNAFKHYHNQSQQMLK